MPFVSHSSTVRGRAFFAPIVLIVFIAAMAFSTNAAVAKSVHVNVLAHFGVKGLTPDQPGSQSQIYTKNGFKPSTKVGKIVPVEGGVAFSGRTNEKIMNAGYNYSVNGSSEVTQGKWNGKGVLPLTRSIQLHGETVQISVRDVFVWALIPNHQPYMTMSK